MRQVQADCAFLESCHIMDYSMLLGVHFRGREGAQSAGEGLANNFSEFSGEQGGWYMTTLLLGCCWRVLVLRLTIKLPCNA